MILGLLSVLIFSFSNTGASENITSYYSSLATTKDVKSSLFTLLDSYHLTKNGADLILPSCSEVGCFKHTPVSYTRAKQLLFGTIHLKGSSSDGFSLETYYCGDILTNKDLGGGNSLGIDKIPNNNIVNTEHAWPQSHFTSKFPKSMQKADLHILFPERSKVNSVRGNFPFGEVVDAINEPCSGVALGISEENEKVFEPIPDVKGDMARATFYYVTRYKVNLDPNQEAYLREWHRQDPVDDHEKNRNEQIFEIQKIRNPFIDKPELVDQISEF